MKKILILSTVFALLFPVFNQTIIAGDLTGREILEESQTLDVVDDFEAEASLQIIRGDRTRERELIMLSIKTEDGEERALTRFTAPSDVEGTGFLNITYPDGEEESWLYLPAMGSERRMVSDERGGSFMGSDFTYEDISMTLDDYHHEIIDQQELNEREVYVIESVPVSDEIADDIEASKRVTYIDSENLYIHQIEVFDLNGNLDRTIYAENIQEIVEGLFMPLRMVVETENGDSTILEYRNVQADVGIDPADLSRRNLSRPIQ